MPDRVLIYRLGSLGDTVIALPCFHLLRRNFPDARIAVLTNAPVSGKAAPLAAVLENSGLVDDVLSYPVGLRDPQKLAQLLGTLREHRFDVMVSLTAARGLPASVRDYLFFKMTRIPKVLGIPFEQRDLTCPRLPDGSGYTSEAIRLLHRIREFGSMDLADPASYDLRLTAAEHEEAGRLLDESHLPENLVAASLGTKSPLKDWGTENWQRLLTRLSQTRPGHGLVLLGSADEADRHESLISSWNGPVLNLSGRTSPRISAALLHRARIFIGHDSGPMHLAAAVGTHCVSVFSAQSYPGQWFPLGVGHCILYPHTFFHPDRVTDLAYQQQAIASITVEQMLAAATEALA